MFQGNLLCLSLCPWPVVLAGAHWEQPGSVTLAPSLPVPLYIEKVPLILQLSRLNSPSSLRLSWEQRCSSSLLTSLAFLLDALQCVPVPCTREPRPEHRAPAVAWAEGQDQPPQPPGNAPLLQPRVHSLPLPKGHFACSCRIPEPLEALAWFAQAQTETIAYFQRAGNQHFSHEDILWLIFHIIGNKPCREETGASGVLNHLLCQMYPLISRLVPVYKDRIRIQSYICNCHYKLYLNNQTWLCEIISPIVAFKIFSFAGDIFNPHYCN